MRIPLKDIMDSGPEREWSPCDIAKGGDAGPVLIGCPERIADELERWVAVGHGSRCHIRQRKSERAQRSRRRRLFRVRLTLHC